MDTTLMQHQVYRVEVPPVLSRFIANTRRQGINCSTVQ